MVAQPQAQCKPNFVITSPAVAVACTTQFGCRLSVLLTSFLALMTSHWILTTVVSTGIHLMELIGAKIKASKPAVFQVQENRGIYGFAPPQIHQVLLASPVLPKIIVTASVYFPVQPLQQVWLEVRIRPLAYVKLAILTAMAIRRTLLRLVPCVRLVAMGQISGSRVAVSARRAQKGDMEVRVATPQPHNVHHVQKIRGLIKLRSHHQLSALHVQLILLVHLGALCRHIVRAT